MNHYIRHDITSVPEAGVFVAPGDEFHVRHEETGREFVISPKPFACWIYQRHITELLETGQIAGFEGLIREGSGEHAR